MNDESFMQKKPTRRLMPLQMLMITSPVVSLNHITRQRPAVVGWHRCFSGWPALFACELVPASANTQRSFGSRNDHLLMMVIILVHRLVGSLRGSSRKFYFGRFKRRPPSKVNVSPEIFSN